MAAERGDDFLWGTLQQVIALADIVKLIVLDQQMMHATHWRLYKGDAVMARVDVHEIGLQRRDHEVADAKAQYVLIEGQCSVDVRERQKGMAHTLWAGAETGDVAAGLERGLGYVGAVEGFQAVAGRISEGDQPGYAAFISQRCGFAFYSNAGTIQTGG